MSDSFLVEADDSENIEMTIKKAFIYEYGTFLEEPNDPDYFLDAKEFI